ncbi:hypothetical protein [Dactylosporangium sp. NPDC006015]|uniref:hypothetical protein n=1 Tax=Dactylosporangium sp. NPDC006015 TaxID=3154576 RepID=UPI0033A66B9E
MPMLDDVIAMIRGLDGTAPVGAVPPLVLTGVAVLRAAIDMELLERRGLTTASALVILDRDPRHNPAVLAALRQLLQVVEAQEVVQACTVGRLDAGMRIAEDVLTSGGLVLIGRGMYVTDVLLERLANFKHMGQLVEPIMASVPVSP